MIEKVLQLLQERRFAEVKAAALEMHYADIAEVFRELDNEWESHNE